MRISRREFLKYCTIAAGALGLTTTDLLKIEESFAKIGDGGPHVVWIPGQACTGCTVSLANSIFYREVDDLLLFDIDLDYSETLMVASGDNAVKAAVSAIGKTTILALEGAIPHGDNNKEDFCTVWSRTGGILAASSDVNAASTSGAIADGKLVSSFTTGTTLALAAGDVIKAGSELVFGTSLPTGTIVDSAADRAAMAALGATFDTTVSSAYGTDRTNANVTIAATALNVSAGEVEITGGTDAQSTGNPTAGSSLYGATSGGTFLANNSVVTSSFDRLWLMTAANTNTTVTFSYDGSGNPWLLQASGVSTTGATLQSSRAVSGPMIIKPASTIAVGSILKAGTRVSNSTVQNALITNSGIATLFDGYGSTSSTVYTINTSPTFTSAAEIVLQGGVTMAPLTTGAIGSTASTDKTMLHEATLFGSSAAAILCIGTCSSFGGIPAAQGNLTGAAGALYKGLRKPGQYNGALNQYAYKTLNIAGCPPHSDWIVGTIAYILATNLSLPPVEAYARPMDYFGQYQCNAGPCEWRYNQGYTISDEAPATSLYANPKGPLAAITGTSVYGKPTSNSSIHSSKLYKYKWANTAATRFVGCIGVLGCKGRKTKADCSLRRWNADKPYSGTTGYGTGWCVGSGAGCHGCTEPTFPDKVGKFFNFA